MTSNASSNSCCLRRTFSSNPCISSQLLKSPWIQKEHLYKFCGISRVKHILNLIRARKNDEMTSPIDYWRMTNNKSLYEDTAHSISIFISVSNDHTLMGDTPFRRDGKCMSASVSTHEDVPENVEFSPVPISIFRPPNAGTNSLFWLLTLLRLCYSTSHFFKTIYVDHVACWIL